MHVFLNDLCVNPIQCHMHLYRPAETNKTVIIVAIGPF